MAEKKEWIHSLRNLNPATVKPAKQADRLPDRIPEPPPALLNDPSFRAWYQSLNQWWHSVRNVLQRNGN